MSPALIVLAAGASRRFGHADKLLALLNGRAVLQHSLTAYQAPFARKIAVLAPDHKSDLRDMCHAAGFETIVNPQADSGMGTSIAAGIAALTDESHAFIGFGDMPHLRPATIDTLHQAIDDRHSIIVPQYDGRSGHPVVFGATHFAALRNLSGDMGGREIIASCTNLRRLAVNDAGICLDIDTPQDLAEAHDT